ncbi:MAG: 6,7-dimethyl-8-ribityllumazine synthase [Thermoguttaceae bacterium]
MPNVFEGKAGSTQGRFAIVVSRFNESITSRLADGAIETLKKHGVADEAIDVFRVPGAFEIPTVASRLVDAGVYDALICLGAVIKGETSHDEHINRAVSMALAQVGLETGMPVVFGVLTCNTLEQAIARSGGEAGTRGKDRPDSRLGNKGAECAKAALEMLDLLDKIPEAEEY